MRRLRYQHSRMRVEVYDTEGEALDAAAEHVAARLRALDGAAPLAALPGGRSGRALMTALAARDDVPWQTARWCVTHERLRPGVGDERSAELLHREIGTPRRLPPEAIVVPDDGIDAAAGAADYARRLAEGREPGRAVDVVCVALAADGSLAGHARGGAAAGSSGLVTSDADVVSLAPAAVDAARALVVVATGAAVSGAVARLLHDADPSAVPQLLPSERVTWFADRAAAAALLRTARPAGE